VFLGAYHFDGDPAELARGHQRLLDRFPLASLDLHLCVLHDDGITVFDACPSREVFTAFSRSAEFCAAVTAAGLPSPRTEPLGEVHAAHLRETVKP
jgi:hypothetical protein